MRRLWLLSLLLLAACGTPAGGDRSTAGQTVAEGTASAKVHTELAGLYYERAQFAIALNEVELALRADRGHAPAYNVRGLIRMELREDKEAEADFQHSIRLDSTNSETFNNYGWFLCQRGRERESIAQFMAAVKNPLYETPERAWLNAGLCSMKAGDNTRAEEFINRALLLSPGMPQALLGMAELSYARGEYPVAKGYFNRYSERAGGLNAEQLWLGVRIARKLGDRNTEASYGLQLRKRFPDARETQLFMYGE